MRPAGVGGDQVQVGVPLQEVSRSGDGDHDTGASVAATGEPDQLLDGLGPRAGKLLEQLAATPEQGTQQARDGQDDVAVGDFGQDFVAQPLGPEELLLLLAGGAEAAAAAGEGDQNAPAALAAPEPGEAMLEKAAPQELPQHPLDHRSQRAVAPGETLGQTRSTSSRWRSTSR